MRTLPSGSLPRGLQHHSNEPFLVLDQTPLVSLAGWMALFLRSDSVKWPWSHWENISSLSYALIPNAGPFQCVCAQSLSHVWLCTPGTVACQASLSMEFSRQEYWSGLPFPPAGDLPYPGIKPASLEAPALAGRFFTTEPPGNSDPFH